VSRTASCSPKVAVIGLDCAEPSLVFERWREELPNLASLMDSGVYGCLTSTVPPITTPAWMAMVSGRDPGELGVYGFRNRRSGEYKDMGIAFSTSIMEPLLWDRLGRAGFKSLVVGVPQTYPPRPVDGWMVTGFLTPSTDSEFTYPAPLKAEVLSVVADYPFDVPDFRTEDKARLLRDIEITTQARFKLVRYLLETKPWDFFMMVEIGTDRIHHGFWHYMDPEHVLHEPDSPYATAMRDYYRLVDAEVGSVLELLPLDTLVLVVSDHGAQRMDGGFAINEWLLAEGYLKLKRAPDPPAPLEKAEVDWSRTVAWGYGGYYGRLCLNVKGREPAGVVVPDDYDRVRNEIAAKLEAFTLPGGRPLGNRVFRPEDIYREVRNIPPDLIVYFGNLRWRSLGTVGTGRILSDSNDTGPDGANHAQEGLYIAARRGAAARLPRPEAAAARSYLDVAPTVLLEFGLRPPAELRGTPLPVP